MTALATLLKLLDRTVAAAIGLLAAALLLTAFGQVIARFVFNQPFTWVLELDVILLVWLTMLSGYVGVRRGLHMAVDFAVGGRNPTVRKAMALLVQALSALFIAVLGWTSFAIIDAMEGIGFTALPVDQPWMYWSLPVGAGLMLLALAIDFIKTLRAPAAALPVTKAAP